jgi:hypothetical protein
MMAARWLAIPVLAVTLSLAPALPSSAESPSAADSYLSGYAAAVLQRELGLPRARVEVLRGVISLRAEDLEHADRDKVTATLSAIPGVVAVRIAGRGAAPAGPSPPPAAAAAAAGSPGPAPEAFGTGFLKSGLLFDPLRADPRWPHFGASYQRYLDGSGLARLFHQSSHLGDEFLLSSRIDRVNLSYEGLGLLLSRYLIGDALRLYAGGSVLLHRDPGTLERGAVQYGIEVYSPWRLAPGIRPVAALDLQNREQNGWATDLSLRAGLQFESLQLLGRTLQVVVEYFDGHSPNGQFYRDRINYIGLGAHLY